MHKEHEHGKTPPVRPICSGCGSMFENTSAFVQHHIRHIAYKHNSYIQDTPDFIRHIESLNESTTLPENAMLVTIDVKALFTNILHKEGTKCVKLWLKVALDEREDKTVPTGYIIRLLKLILHNNIFLFNVQLYSQKIGVSMGSKPAPHYANIFLARRIDDKINQISQKYSDLQPLDFMKRFLDDILKIFVGSSKELHNFLRN